ncbi:hypothetical protein LS68_006860 [Helicobacter sp. MIT 05-5293]|uniref:hypothetical protein n=1 Tax=Helicobacter sp. MIT 05-5293 TaxID=1548149 RepID=UPI00051DEF18|nr:hypothetical protein [Helicobacter sp. MIT 05-5293]TLD80463.1 hypothetical protein LS68_006860 [Helicobacter sp. MIT 05-5293]
MKNITLRIALDNQSIFKEYQWFWIRSVRDFDDTKHCQASLKTHKNIFSTPPPSQGITTNTDIPITLDSEISSSNPPKVLLGNNRDEIPHYLCLDFLKPFYNQEDKNYIHFGFIYEEGSHIIKTRKDTEFNINFTLQLSNARELYFDDSIVREKYAHLDESYTTCRNFWFGAYYFAKDKA